MTSSTVHSALFESRLVTLKQTYMLVWSALKAVLHAGLVCLKSGLKRWSGLLKEADLNAGQVWITIRSRPTPWTGLV